MAEPLRDVLGRAANTLAIQMTAAAALNAQRQAGAVAELKKLGAPADVMDAGDALSVALHRLAAELGHPALLPPSAVANALPIAALECVAAGGLALARAARWIAAEGLIRAGVSPVKAPPSPPPAPPSGGGVVAQLRKPSA